MRLLKYKDLTEEQKKFITNGCGGKGGWIKPPNFIFKASCNHHDFLYWRGATEEDFKLANIKFYDKMEEDIKEVKNFLKRTHYKIWAYAYFKSVSLFGRKYFNFKRIKTLADLKREMLCLG